MSADTFRDAIATSLLPVNDDEHAKYDIWSRYYNLSKDVGAPVLEYFAWLDRYGLK